MKKNLFLRRKTWLAIVARRLHELTRHRQRILLDAGQEGDIGHPVLGRNLAQGVVVEQFADVFLDGGALGIEPPDPPRMGSQIGDQNMVGILAILEEGQLLSFHRVLRDRAAHDDEAMRVLPMQGLVTKRAGLPSLSELAKATLPSAGFDGGVLLGHDRITAAQAIQELHHPLAETSGVGSEAEARASNVLRDLGQAELQEGNQTRAAHGIAGPQRPMPELLQMRLEANQRVVRTSPPFVRVVPHASILQFAVDGEHHRIEIEG